MNKKELANVVNEIQIKNDHLKRMRYWGIYATLTSLVSLIIAWWGFTNLQDLIMPNVSQAVRTPIAWIMSVIGVVAVLFAILVFIALRNGKKHVLSLIDRLEKDKR
jgi:TRAP-type C4-dicarboxylate transport system permease small subunit